MTTFKSIFLSIIFITIGSSNFKAQCNANTNICSSGNSGPFTFADPGQPVSTCLDFLGPGYAYIILYITESGPLEMLIEGDVTSGFLDVAIFNIPTGTSPCDAILDNSNQISCNYASHASGCNQIGSYFSCPSSITSPNVNVGDILMIIVENWSGTSSSFSLDMAPLPAAQSGPGDPTITPLTYVLNATSSPYQMFATDNGGTWSGPGIDSSGLFDPSITGTGTFRINYNLGSGPCLATDFIDISIQNALAIELSDLQLECKNDQIILKWSTISEINCDYFKIERSFDAQSFTAIDIVSGHGNSSTTRNYIFLDNKNEGQTYYRLVEVDYNGKETIYGPLVTKCTEKKEISIYPNPVKDYLKVKISDSDETMLSYEIKSVAGKLVDANSLNGSIDVRDLSQGYYFLIIKTESQQYNQKFVRE